MKPALTAVLLFFISWSAVQIRAQSQDDQVHIRPKNLPQPKEEPKPEQQGESSSKDSEINLENPGRTPSGNRTNNGVHEMYPYDPHKAAKDVEVGQYYLKRKNYRAALDRFNEALLYKPNDGDGTFYLAQTQERLELFALAYQGYRNYLSFAKDGPHLKEAQEAMKRIEPHLPAAGDGQAPSALAQLIKQGESDLAKNDFEAAYDSFAKAVQAAPDDPVVNFRLAQSLVGLERLDEARVYYKKYLSLQPDGKMAGDAKREIARINLMLGKL